MRKGKKKKVWRDCFLDPPFYKTLALFFPWILCIRTLFSHFFFPSIFTCFEILKLSRPSLFWTPAIKTSRCSTLGFCRRNGEAAAIAVCFVWWLYYRTILRKRRLGSCSSCTLPTPGSFFLSLLSISTTHFFFCILFALFLFCEWYGLGCRKLGEEKQCRDGGGGDCWCCWDCCFCFFFFTVAPPFRVSWLVCSRARRVSTDVFF